MSSPESIAVEGDTPADTFSAVPTTSGDGGTLTGILATDEKLPDLVVNQNEPATTQPENMQETLLAANTTSTEEELEAASTLLSLGDTRDDTLDEEDENALLMPIGGVNILVDVAPNHYDWTKSVLTMPLLDWWKQSNWKKICLRVKKPPNPLLKKVRQLSPYQI